MRTLFARGVDDREDHREIEALAGRRIYGIPAAFVKARLRVPMFVKGLEDLPRRREAGLPGGAFHPNFLHPSRAVGERGMLQKPRIIMLAEFLFPQIETGLAPMLKGKAKIRLDQRRAWPRGSRSRGHSQARSASGRLPATRVHRAAVATIC